MDRERERQIVIKAREQGKSDEFIKQAVLRDRERRAAAQPQVQPEPEVGLGQSIVQGVASPFLKMFETGKDIISGATNIGLSLGAKALGKDEAAMEYLNKAKKATETAGDYGYLGKVKGMTKLREGVGAGLEIGSYAIGAPGVKNIFAQGAKAIMPNILKLAGYGAVTGGTTGLGIGLQQEDATLGSVAKSTAGGAVVGGIAAPLFSAATTGLTKAAYATGVPQKILSKTEKGTKFLSNAISEAKTRIAKTYEKSLPLTPTQLSKETSRLANTGDNLFTTLAKHNINVGDITTAIDDLDNLSSTFSSPSARAVANDPTQYNLTKLLDRVYQNIDDRIKSAVDRTKAKERATKEVIALISEVKDKIILDKDGNPQLNAGLMSRLRQIGNNMTPFDATDPTKVGKSTGYSISDAVRDVVEEDGLFEGYRQLNKEWSQVLHAKEMLEEFAAKGKKFKVLGGLSGTIARRVLSAGYGFSRGGIGGAVLASLGSETAADVLANPTLRTFFDRKMVEYAGKKVTPEIVTKLTNEINDYLARQSNLFKLEAPINSTVMKMTRSGMQKAKGPATPQRIYVQPKGTPNKAGFTTSPVVKTIKR